MPFPSPGDLPNLGIEPGSPALQAGSLPAEPPGTPMESQGLFTCTAVTPSHGSSVGECTVFLLRGTSFLTPHLGDSSTSLSCSLLRGLGWRPLGPFFKHLSFLNCNLCFCSPRVGSCAHNCYLHDAKEHRQSNLFCKGRVVNMSDFVSHMPLKKILFIIFCSM